MKEPTTGKHETWRDVLDRMLADSETLGPMYVSGEDAREARNLARHVNKSVWLFINSVEGIYRSRLFDLGGMLREAAKIKDQPISDALIGLAEAGGISVHGAAVVDWAKKLGMDPEWFATEAWADDIKEDENARPDN